MLQTQINIYNGRKQFRYGVEYVDNIEYTESQYYAYLESEDLNIGSGVFQFVNIYNQNVKSYKRETNIWKPITQNLSQDYLPSIINLSSINVYFPSYGVETYTGNWKYMFSAYTYINGDKIILCEQLLDRRDALSYYGKKEMNNIRYSEYINVRFPDPWEITYSNSWAQFRQLVCGEPSNINNTGSLLTIEIHPVKDYKVSGEKVKLDNYLGGMNSILLSNNQNMSLHNIIEYNSTNGVDLTLKYNDIYQNGVEEYLIETYNLSVDSNISISSSLSLYDSENIYNIYGPITGQNVIFDNIKRPEDDYTTITFKEDWSEFKPGLQFKAITTVSLDGEPLIALQSNPLQIGQYEFAKFISSEPKYNMSVINNLFNNDPNTPEMNNMDTINIVNKTKKEVINIEKPNDFKNNLTRPVFIRTQNSNGIVIHPKATENIAINLREYKNYVNTFTLRISDVDFTEYGRQSSNVIFKVVGKQLPEEIENGTFYILDDNSEIITTGNYTIE